MALSYKYVEQLGDGQKAVLVNEKGLPVVFDDEDDEFEPIGLDGIHLYQKVPELNKESSERKKKIRTMEDRFKVLDGVDDVGGWVKEAKKALSTLKNLDDKKLIDAGEVETIKKQAKENLELQLVEQKKTFEEKLKDAIDKTSSQDKTIRTLMIDDQFNTSGFVREKLSITPRVAKKYFADNFSVEQDDAGRSTVMGYYNNGDKIFSKERPGEPASFEEALALLVERDPDKNSIKVGTIAAGAGAKGSRRAGGLRGSDLANLPPEERLKVIHRTAAK